MREPESNIITKPESSEADLSALSLAALALRLNERERAIQTTRDMVIDKAAWTVKRAVEQGRDLKEVRKRLAKEGTWMLWLETKCPLIHYSTANRYIKVHDRFSTMENAELDSKSLTQLYIGCGLLPEPEGNESEAEKTERGPAIFQWLGRATVWLEKRGGVKELAEPERNKLKEMLRPIWEAL